MDHMKSEGKAYFIDFIRNFFIIVAFKNEKNKTFPELVEISWKVFHSEIFTSSEKHQSSSLDLSKLKLDDWIVEREETSFLFKKNFFENLNWTVFDD